MKILSKILCVISLLSPIACLAEIGQFEYHSQYYIIPNGKTYLMHYADSISIRSLKDFSCKVITTAKQNVYIDINNDLPQYLVVTASSPLIIKPRSYTPIGGEQQYMVAIQNYGCSFANSLCNPTAGIDTGTDVSVTCNPV